MASGTKSTLLAQGKLRGLAGTGNARASEVELSACSPEVGSGTHPRARLVNRHSESPSRVWPSYPRSETN